MRTFYSGKSVWTLLPLFCLLFLGCKPAPAESEAEEKEKFILPDSLLHSLEVDTVRMAKQVNSITLTGKISFNDNNVLKIYPLVSGNIQDVKVMLGDYVEKGQVLAVIKSSEMAGYSNDLITAEANVKVARKNLEATEDLYKTGLASSRDLLAAQTGYDQALAALDKANRILKINGGNRDGEFRVIAPISGFIVEKFVTNNMAIRSDNGNNLFTISDLKNVWVLANVYETNIQLVHAGDPVDVTTLSYPGETFKGRIDKVMNVLDPANKVMKVRVVLSNEKYKLKPEMFANVTVSSNGSGFSPCIPSKAVIFDHSQYYVLLYSGPTDIRITPVSVINTVGEKTYVSSGLKEGDRIISSQAILIYDALNK
jgi:membrane fusion protein, heavy metal efflux system